MKIRQAAVSDVPELVSLNHIAQDMHADAFPERFRRDAPDQVVAHAFGAMIAAPSSYWLVAEEEQPVGFLSAEFRERDESWCLVSHRVCYLAGIVVAAAFRRRGIARALFGALQREADARGASCIEVDVWAFNEEARQVFVKLGFRGMMERLTLSAEKPIQPLEPTLTVTPDSPMSSPLSTPSSFRVSVAHLERSPEEDEDFRAPHAIVLAEPDFREHLRGFRCPIACLRRCICSPRSHWHRSQHPKRRRPKHVFLAGRFLRSHGLGWILLCSI